MAYGKVFVVQYTTQEHMKSTGHTGNSNMNDLKFTTAGDFLSQQRRIGFACKYMHPNRPKKKLLEEIQRPQIQKISTTVQWLNRQTREVFEQRLWDNLVRNIPTVYESYYICSRIAQMNYVWSTW